MAENGVRTPDVTAASVLDEIIGNRDGSTVRQLITDLAVQLLGGAAFQQALEELRGQITSGQISTDSWADLLLIDGGSEGTGAEVLDSDAGTHAAASATGYDGTSVSNAGRYSWNASWSRWVRIGDTGLAGKAPLASPGLTGTPTAPTAAPGTNSTQIANAAFVQAAITAAVDALVAAAPGQLDTLQEIAAALGDDANYAATVTAQLAQKAPLASPAFNGTPTAPTAPQGTATTQIATTAFVEAVRTAIAARIDHIAITDLTRPGDSPEQFSQSLVGEPEARPAIAQGAPAVDDDLGQCWSLPGAGVIAPRRAFALEDGRVYRLRVAYKRLVDSTDPSGDAVELKLRTLDADKSAIASMTLNVAANPNIADGLQLLSIIVSKDTEAPGVEAVPAVGTRYCTPYLETFGDTPTTGIGFFQWEDITDVISGGADVADLRADLTSETNARTAAISALDLAKAPLASPAFTGAPTAPTASPGSNTTQIANAAFVQAAVTAAVDALVDAAPGQLDTLQEIAAALGDDANYAATITSALAQKAPLASPALTGTPTVPTAAPGTSSLQAASTAFVAAAAQLIRDQVAAKVVTREVELGTEGTEGQPRMVAMASGGATMTDAGGIELMGLNSDGSWRLKLAMTVANRLFQQQLSAASASAIFQSLGLGEALTTALVNTSEVSFGASGRIMVMDGEYLFVSSDGLVLARFAEDGSLVAKASDWSVGKLRLGLSGAGRPQIVPTSAGGTAFATGDGIEALGFDGAKLRFHPSDVTIARFLGPLGIGNPLDNTQLVAIGDSLTKGTGASYEEAYWNVLRGLTGRPATQVAQGGMVAKQVSALWGTERIHLTVTGGSIPASGGVAVTSDIDILVNGGQHQTAYTARGFLAGVEGTLSTDTSGNYTFTRLSSGTAVSVDATNNRFVLSQTGTAFNPGLGAYYDATKMVCLGRNGPRGTDAERRATHGHVCNILRAGTARYDNHYVFSVPNSSSEPAGTSAYDDVMALNQLFRDTFGPRFIDWRSYLVTYGIYDAGIAPTAQDVTDMANDVIPESFRSDTTHLNALGYALWGNYAFNFIR